MEKDLEKIEEMLDAAAFNKSDQAVVAIGYALVALCDRLDKMTGTIGEGETKKALTVYDWSRNS